MSLGYVALADAVAVCEKHTWSEPTNILIHKCALCGAVERLPEGPAKRLVPEIVPKAS